MLGDIHADCINKIELDEAEAECEGLRDRLKEANAKIQEYEDAIVEMDERLERIKDQIGDAVYDIKKI